MYYVTAKPSHLSPPHLAAGPYRHRSTARYVMETLLPALQGVSYDIIADTDTSAGRAFRRAVRAFTALPETKRRARLFPRLDKAALKLAFAAARALDSTLVDRRAR